MLYNISASPMFSTVGAQTPRSRFRIATSDRPSLAVIFWELVKILNLWSPRVTADTFPRMYGGGSTCGLTVPQR